MANETFNVDRRNFLGLVTAASVAVTAPAAPAQAAAPQKPDLLKSVVSFLCHASHCKLNDMGLLAEYAAIIQTPPNYGSDVERVIDDFIRLKKIGYACEELKRDIYAGLTVADITSDEWDDLEREWFPLITGRQKNSEHSVSPYSENRLKLAKILSEASFPETISLADAADTIKEQCVSTVQNMIRRSYRHDPLGFIHKFHADGENVGLKLHYFFERKDGYQEFGEYIPPDIAKHIESVFPFSGWAKDWKMPAPTGLNGRLFDLGVDGAGQRLFHIALSLSEANKALTLLVGDSGIENCRMLSATNEGIVLTLGPDKYKIIADKIGNFSIPMHELGEPRLHAKQHVGAQPSPGTIKLG